MFKGIVLAILSLVVFSFASAKNKRSNDPTAGRGDITAPGPDITAPGPDITAGRGDITAPGDDPTADYRVPASGSADGFDKGTSRSSQIKATQVDEVISSAENDFLYAGAKQMNASYWDVQGDPVNVTQEVVLKKHDFTKIPYDQMSEMDSVSKEELLKVRSDGKPWSVKGSDNPWSIKGTYNPASDKTGMETGVENLMQFEKVLLPARAGDKQPRCKISILRNPKSLSESETLTVGSGSKLKPSKVVILSSDFRKSQYYVEKFEVTRGAEKKADLTLICDLSKQAAVSKSEVQAAFSKLGFEGTVPLGLKDPPRAASKKSSPSEAVNGKN
jgi:hypothetical protein